MARRKSPQQPLKTNPVLIHPRSEVAAALEDRVAEGVALRDRPVNTQENYEQLKMDRTAWSDYNREYLARAFDSDTIADEYSRYVGTVNRVNPTLGHQINNLKDGIGTQVARLESIVGRLELIPEADGVAAKHTTAARPDRGEGVFVVHGHDNETKQSVARFVEKLGLNAIILHEQPNAGMTLIEKFEHNALDVGFAIILLTPDDVGAPRAEPENLRPRARQNVILELGYFCGMLGRDRVMVLHGEDVEIPSDFDGVVYEPFKDESWKLPLAKELKEAGLPVDMNDAL